MYYMLLLKKLNNQLTHRVTCHFIGEEMKPNSTPGSIRHLTGHITGSFSFPFHGTVILPTGQDNEMEPAAAAGESRDPPPPPPPEDLSTVEPSPSSSSSSSATAVVAPGTQALAPPGAREVAAAMEAVERDAAAIAESYASLFASLRVALSNVRTLSLRSNTGRAFRALLQCC
jgi:hypothetical protein